ncbi:hypothetical protein [Saccharopolyspora hattusasensis]|uniref:hypothetical protein n=1 Tax=Saccharopolyspora hattusasensis TaxID=1128679 RepID=UPI003D97577B
MGLFQGVAERLDFGAVLFLEAFDLGGEGEQQVVVGVAGVGRLRLGPVAGA